MSLFEMLHPGVATAVLFIGAVRARVGNDGGVAAPAFPPSVYLFIGHNVLVLI